MYKRQAYYLGLTTLIFTSIVKYDLKEIFNIGIVKILYTTFAIFIVIVFISVYFLKVRRKTKGAIAISSFRCNMAFVGIPIKMCIRDRNNAWFFNKGFSEVRMLNALLKEIFFTGIGVSNFDVTADKTKDFLMIINEMVLLKTYNAVSYTHLDVYKRQPLYLCQTIELQRVVLQYRVTDAL